jgi:hypothetical protein
MTPAAENDAAEENHSLRGSRPAKVMLQRKTRAGSRGQQ